MSTEPHDKRQNSTEGANAQSVEITQKLRKHQKEQNKHNVKHAIEVIRKQENCTRNRSNEQRNVKSSQTNKQTSKTKARSTGATRRNSKQQTDKQISKQTKLLRQTS